MTSGIALNRLHGLAASALALLPGLGLLVVADLPFPTTQALFHGRTEATDGGRAGQREGWAARGDDPCPRWRVLQECAPCGDGA